MTIKINGTGNFGQKLTGGLDYFTLTTTVNIIPTGVFGPVTAYTPNALSSTNTVVIAGVTYNGTVTNSLTDYTIARASQIAFDRLLEVITTRGQPVIIGTPVWNGSTAYTFVWASEHRDAWLNITQGAGQTVPYTDPGAITTNIYDSSPTLVALIRLMGSATTYYPGTADSSVVTFKDHGAATVSFATATTLVVTNTL